ncbi:hypothetical protein [Caulobacter endophyticus]|nr:hypothetical protein [Caulobacter endophyticus]
MRSLLILLFGLSLSACATVPLNEPISLGEKNAAYSYIPLDPLPVSVQNDKGCATTVRTLLDNLPDNAVRIAIQQISGKTDATLGPAVLGASGNQYQVTLDYINADTANIRFLVGYRHPGDKESVPLPITRDFPQDAEVVAIRLAGDKELANGNEVVIPVYVGVGLRLTATVQVIKGKINLSSLGAIAASVEGEKAAGSLVVQTLGINGKQVAASMPLPSELNSTTVANAIQSLGAVKAILYDSANTRVVPRVTGIYNPLPSSDPRVINAIVSQLAKSHIPWSPPCSGVGTTQTP